MGASQKGNFGSITKPYPVSDRISVYIKNTGGLRERSSTVLEHEEYGIEKRKYGIENREWGTVNRDYVLRNRE